MLHPVSLIIPFLILLPNFLFFKTTPNNPPAKNETKENPILIISEWTGRIGVFILPLFSAINAGSVYEIASLTGMLLSLVFYYFCWVRYFRGNREFKLLFSPVLGIPVPMAISPIIYFLLASVVLHSPYLFLSSMILAIGHIPISLNTYYHINRQ